MTTATLPPPDEAGALFTALLTMTPPQLAKALSAEPDKVLRLVRAAAECGLAEGQLRYGRMWLDGLGCARDPIAAVAWFARAAEQGHAGARNMLGRCCENGWGTATDFAAAAHWYRLAAEAGDAWGQYNLGHLYLNGYGVTRDAAKALAWYRAASHQGHARARNLVGRCCEQGWGTQKDLDEAARWYRLSAEGGYFRGQYNHASLLMAQGKRDEAETWFQRAIAQAPEPSQTLMIADCAEAWGLQYGGLRYTSAGHDADTGALQAG